MDKIYQRLVFIVACTPFHHFGFAMLVLVVLRSIILVLQC